MRVLAVIVLSPLLPLAAAAQQTGEAGAGLKVHIVPGERTVIYGSPTEAQAACTGAGGNFGLESGRFVCVNPRARLESTRAEVAPPAAPSHAPGQDASARGMDVESITLRPGEAVSFTLAEGFNHQLLRRSEPSAPGAISVGYEVTGNVSRVTATSRTGHALTFRVLADPDGNGGFSPAGEIALPGDGTPAVRDWPGSLGTISIGSFVRPD